MPKFEFVAIVHCYKCGTEVTIPFHDYIIYVIEKYLIRPADVALFCEVCY